MFLELEPASECSPVARSAQHSDDVVIQVVVVSPLRPAVNAGGQGAVLQRWTYPLSEPSGQALVLKKGRLRPQEGTSLI